MFFYQNSFSEITDAQRKLRTYSIFKSEARKEPYLSKVIDLADKITFSKFRLSNHKLMIEKKKTWRVTNRHAQMSILSLR